MSAKPTYEKPVAMDMGSLKPVHGAVCSSGFAAAGACTSTGHRPDEGCGNGNDPDLIPYCNTTGNIATANCNTNGSQAGEGCNRSGSSAGWSCFRTGGDPEWAP